MVTKTKNKKDKKYRTKPSEKRKYRERRIEKEDRNRMTVLFIRRVPSTLRDLFKKKCEREYISMTERILQLMQEDLLNDQHDEDEDEEEEEED